MVKKRVGFPLGNGAGVSLRVLALHLPYATVYGLTFRHCYISNSFKRSGQAFGHDGKPGQVQVHDNGSHNLIFCRPCLIAIIAGKKLA
jgi:hypothetical protein